MKLLRTYKTKKEIPDFALALYEERDGAFHLREGVEIEGSTPPDDDTRDEFRENNKKLNRELNNLKAEKTRLEKLMEGFDPDQWKQFQEVIAKNRDAEEAALLKAGNVDEVVKRRIQRTVEEKDVEIRNRTKAFDELKSKYDQMALTFTQQKAQRKVTELIEKKGLRLRKYAAEDLNARITADWTSDDNGNLQLKNSNLLNDKGEGMSPEEYVEKELVQRRSYFFEPMKGGGAGDDRGEPENPGGGNSFVARDPVSFGRNLDAIAKGEKKVAPRGGR